MKQPNSFSILLALTLILLVPNLTAAMLAEEASRIPFQVNNSDRIVNGTVSRIVDYGNYTIVTITVKEWLYNPLPTKTIRVRTETGSSFWTEDEAEFVMNESTLLMLKDENLEKQLFRVSMGFPGKHSVSDREAVIKELKFQGKWKGEDQTDNMTNQTEKTINTETADSQTENVTENKTVDNGKEENTGTVDKQGDKSDTTQKSNSIPFTSSFWVLAIVLGTVIYLRKMKQ
jgi:hypothetical protein